MNNYESTYIFFAEISSCGAASLTSVSSDNFLNVDNSTLGAVSFNPQAVVNEPFVASPVREISPNSIAYFDSWNDFSVDINKGDAVFDIGGMGWANSSDRRQALELSPAEQHYNASYAERINASSLSGRVLRGQEEDGQIPPSYTSSSIKTFFLKIGVKKILLGLTLGLAFTMLVTICFVKNNNQTNIDCSDCQINIQQDSTIEAIQYR